MNKLIYPLALAIAGFSAGCSDSNSSPASEANSALPNYILFKGATAQGNLAIYRTDGSAEGTYAVQELAPAPQVLPQPAPRAGILREGLRDSGHFSQLGKEYVYSFSEDGNNELFISDGSVAGTRKFADITPNGASNPNAMTAIGDKIYYGAVNPNDSSQRILAISDGSEAGNTLITNVSVPRGFTTDAEGNVFFQAEVNGRSALYVTDGTQAGTELIFESRSAIPSTSRSNLSNYPNLRQYTKFIAYQGRLYFGAEPHDAIGSNTLNFWSIDIDGNIRLELSDNSGTVTTEQQRIALHNNKLYFTGAVAGNAAGLYELDSEGFREVSNATLSSDSPTLISSAQGLFAVDDDLQVLNNSGDFETLSSGSAANTFSDIDGLWATAGKTFFTAETQIDGAPAGNELWQTDGSTAGTRFVKDVAPQSDDGYPIPLTYDYLEAPKLSGRLATSSVFFANNDTTGFEPWVSDGTPSGTQMIVDLVPGSDSSVGFR